MKPFGLRSLGVAALLAAFARPVHATPISLTATTLYTAASQCGANPSSPGVPVQVNAVPVTGSGSCSPDRTCGVLSSLLYPDVECFTSDGTTAGAFEVAVKNLFGSNPYLIVETYSSASCAAPADITGIATYWADGKCHKTDTSASYKATRSPDGSASVLTYSTADCTGSAASTFTWTAAMADPSTGNACDGSANGLANKKVYGGGATFYLTSIVRYDTNVGGCNSPTVPTQLSTTIGTTDTCTASSTCAGSAIPYTGTNCNTVANYKTDVATMYGSNPYILVESYAAAKSCDPAFLTGITTYLADGKCHKTDTAASYRATRAADGSASILTHSTADCTGSAVHALTWITAMADPSTGNTCDNTANGLVDKKVYGGGATLYLTSIVSYDTSVGGCNSPAVPTLLSTTIVTADTCVATSACAGSAVPYTRTNCNTVANYKTDVATMYGSNPYILVESYAAAKSCDPAFLTGITTYLADGKCHKTDTAASYRATRAADGSASILTYSTADCTGVSMPLDMSSTQSKGQSCAADANGIMDKKAYGAGATTLYLSSALRFDDNMDLCVSPAVPTSVTTTVAASATACTATTVCSGTADPWIGTACSTSLTYSSDLLALFGTNPYVVVESYRAGKKCDGTKLLAKNAYLADGVCHKTGTSASYKATRKEDGAITINMFTDSSICDTVGATLAMTAAQVMGNSCAADGNGIPDTKVYSSGAAQQYLSTTMVYDTKMGDCKLPAVPTQLFSAVVDKKSCVSSNYCTGGPSPYNGTICTSTSSYQKDVAAVFGSNPYVIVEKYGSGKSCSAAALFSIGTYVADTKCHRSSSSTSFRAIRKADGSATIMTYAESGSCGRGPATLAVTAEQATSNSCASGSTGVVDAKLYGGGATPLFLTVTAVYSSNANGCKMPSTPMVWVATPLSVDVCVPSAGCHYAGPLPTSTVCSSTRTYHADVAVAFDWNPHVTVQKYISGKGCSESALSSVTTYLADGSCHSSSSFASFSATQRTDGSVMIEIYLDSMYCGTEGWKLTASAAQATSHACISTGFGDIKVSSIQK
ncbi:hypothetical protein PRIC1_001926 [Phytophthora ramorum]